MLTAVSGLIRGEFEGGASSLTMVALLEVAFVFFATFPLEVVAWDAFGGISRLKSQSGGYIEADITCMVRKSRRTKSC